MNGGDPVRFQGTHTCREGWDTGCHDDVIQWKLFRVTGPLCGEFTGDRWIPLTKGQ